MLGSNAVANQLPRVAEFYHGKSVFITGAAGFVGSVLLEALLRCCPGIKSIYTLLRTKKNVQPEGRKEQIFNKKVFEKLKKEIPESLGKVRVIPGDASLPNLGMNEDDTHLLLEEVSIVFHCAAVINFKKPLGFILKNNALSLSRVIELCRKLRKFEVLVYTSTAYSNSNHLNFQLKEEVYRLPFHARKFLDALKNEDKVKLQELIDHCKPDWPNVYSFSKCLAENVIADTASDLPVAIIRPSIVVSTWKHPIPGYVEENSGIILLSLGMIFEDSDDDDSYRDYSQVLPGNDNEAIDTVENMRETSQEIVNIPIPVQFDQVGSGSELVDRILNGFWTQLADVPEEGSDDLDSAILLMEKARRNNRRFQCDEIVFAAMIDIDKLPLHARNATIRKDTIRSLLQVLQNLFQAIIDKATRNLAPTDLIRLLLQSDHLDRPISTTLMPVSQMTAEKFLSCLIKAIQSDLEIPLDAAFIVDIIVIQRPVGGGGKGHHRVINFATDRLRKKSVLSIMPEETGICCAKAILLALASKESPTELNSLCDARNTVLERRAIKLHNDVGIPLGPCGVKEIAAFERHLDIQVIVISSEEMHQVSYVGQKGRGRCIFGSITNSMMQYPLPQDFMVLKNSVRNV